MENTYTTKEAYSAPNISSQIEPYFNYYADKYPAELLGDCLFIEIPMMDGSASLDHYFINPLLKNGYTWHENWLLSKIYLIKALKKEATA